MTPRQVAGGPIAEEESLVVTRWVLRLLVHGELTRLGHRRVGTIDWRALCDGVGVAVSGRRKTPPPDLAESLARRLEELESAEPETASPFFVNVRTLGELLGLSEVDRELLALCGQAERHPLMKLITDPFDSRSVTEMRMFAASALGRRAPEIARALRSSGALVGGGLVTHGFVGPGLGSAGGLPALSTRVEAALLGPALDRETLFGLLAPTAPPAERCRADFAHLDDDLAVVVRVLASAQRSGERVNLLLHGPPGTGKTELARVLGAEVGARVYPVTVEDDDGDPLDAAERLKSYQLLQRLLGGSGAALLLFDESEDVFPAAAHTLFGPARPSPKGKGFINAVLESGSVSTVWISNEVAQIDPAYLRRFDLALAIDTPPRSVRRRILADRLSGLPVDGAHLDRLAAREELTPAEAARIERVMRLHGADDPGEAERVLDRVVEARAGRAVARDDGPQRGLRYDLGFVRADVDLARLVGGLAREGRGTVLLEGPPGCGKTAFAERLGDVMDRPLVRRTASDLLGCYVGQTEANLAAMFREAEREGAVLFLDEADSFLQARTRALRTWEVTQVNELLVQMERFDGVFLCATNLPDVLDGASLRRFGAKVRFEPPDAEARWQLFRETLRSLAGSAPRGRAATNMRRALDGLHGLVVGDFVAASRRMRLLGDRPLPSVLLEALRAERARKRDAGKDPVGFR